MTNTTGGPEDVRRGLIERGAADESFRQRLLTNPKVAIEEEIGAKLPDDVEVRVVEETPDTIYLVLPPTGATSGEGGELSDRELESVAGGWESGGTSGESTCGQQVTCFRCGPRA